MRKGQRVQLRCCINGETKLMTGKIKVLDGRLAWVEWDDGRVLRCFASSLEKA